jgi:hypothetical protein
MNATAAALAALTALATPARLARATEVQVDRVSLTLASNELRSVTAATGEGGKYTTRITLAPARGFRCSCPDAGHRKLVCKHALALAARLAAMV